MKEPLSLLIQSPVSRPIFFVSVILVSVIYLSMGAEEGLSAAVPVVPSRSGSEAKEQDFHYKFTVQKGFFMQSEDETDDRGFDFVCCLFSSYLSPPPLLCFV